jgi:SAM-dependent methyltransferase
VGEQEDAARVFGHIYEQDHWDGGSGVGSAPDATEAYRAVLAQLLPSADITSVVDVGCGDWQLGSLVDWSSVQYLGLDVVPAVIERNQSRFAKPGVRFELLDARLQPPPAADLLLAKDVLQHWSNADAAAFLRTNLRRYRYCLITNDVESTHWDGPVNQDVLLGEWRTMDVELQPFGHTAAWRRDFDVRGEWLKRMTLFAAPTTRLTARFRSKSALARIREWDRRTPQT